MVCNASHSNFFLAHQSSSAVVAVRYYSEVGYSIPMTSRSESNLDFLLYMGCHSERLQNNFACLQEKEIHLRPSTFY
jgi:hypothetical protein